MIKIMIDSVSDIRQDEAEKMGLIVLPMVVTIGKEEYLDGINLSVDEFYDKMEAGEALPKTSQINAFRFEEEFEKHTANGEELIVITLSSKLSGTYANACQAAEKFKGKVFVVDSLTASIGERLFAQYALRLREKGLSAQEIVAKLESKRGKVFVLAVLGTLEYLKKGGRISGAAAFAGSLLSIKPIIGVIAGEVKLLGKALGAKKGMKILNKLIKEKDGFDTSMPYGLVWSGKDDKALEEYKKDGAAEIFENVSALSQYRLGVTMGTHIGPGGYGVAYFAI